MEDSLPKHRANGVEAFRRTSYALIAVALLVTGCERAAEATPDEIFAASKPFRISDAGGAELVGVASALASSPQRDLEHMNFQEAIDAVGYAQLLKWAEALDPNAALFVAIAHIRGTTGALRNDALAAQWLLRAANLGAPAAQDAAGLWAYREALQSRADRNQPRATRMAIRAYVWFNLAQAHGYAGSERHMQQLIAALQPNNSAVRTAQSLAASWRRCEARTCWDLHPDGEQAVP